MLRSGGPWILILDWGARCKLIDSYGWVSCSLVRDIFAVEGAWDVWDERQDDFGCTATRRFLRDCLFSGARGRHSWPEYDIWSVVPFFGSRGQTETLPMAMVLDGGVNARITVAATVATSIGNRGCCAIRIVSCFAH